MIALGIKVVALLKRVPWQVHAALALIALSWLLMGWHERRAQDAHDVAYAAGGAAADARHAKKAAEWVARINDIAAKQRIKNDETNRRIAGDADALRLSGPGKAACLNPATPGPGGRVAPARPGDAAVDQVPDTERVDLIALPFADALAFAEQHDLCRAEAMTWRDTHQQQADAWAKAEAN